MLAGWKSSGRVRATVPDNRAIDASYDLVDNGIRDRAYRERSIKP